MENNIKNLFKTKLLISIALDKSLYKKDSKKGNCISCLHFNTDKLSEEELDKIKNNMNEVVTIIRDNGLLEEM